MKVPEPRKLKSGSWFIQLRLGGVSVPVTAETKTACKKQAELIKAEHRTGVRTAARPARSVTLDAAVGQYIDSRRAVLSPSTIRGYATIRRTRFQSVMEDKLAEIDWQRAVNDEARLCGAKTLKNAWGLMVSVLGHYGLPVPSVQLPQLVAPDKAWLEPEQIPVFIEAVRREPYAVPALLALHGLRRSEIYALDWPSVDLSKGTISIRGAVVRDETNQFVKKETAKNQTSRRTIPLMIPALAELLAQAKGEGRPVVEGSPSSLLKQINRTCTRCGLPAVGVHGLRHSFASLGYHLGIPEREMMELGGWSDTTTMHKIYTHIAQADRLKSENKLAGFFKNANENANYNLQSQQNQGL